MKNSMAKKVFHCSITALLLMTASSIFSAYAAQNQDSGTINFYGAIVHPNCTNDISETQIKLHCMNNNTELTTESIELNNITQKSGWKVINDGRNEYSYNWANEEKQLGMLTVKYI